LAATQGSHRRTPARFGIGLAVFLPHGAGGLQWVEEMDGKEMMYDHDPHTGCWRPAAVFVASLLPIEWLL
jgi:hypothetical protein